MADEERHVLVNFWVVAQIAYDVGPECSEIGEPSAVDDFGVVDAESLVVFLQFLLLLLDIFGDNLES